MVRVVSIGVPVDGSAEGSDEPEVAAILHRILRRHASDEFIAKSKRSSSPPKNRSAKASAESSRSPATGEAASATGSRSRSILRRSREEIARMPSFRSTIIAIQKAAERPKSFRSRAKRRGQAAVAELQAKHKAWEKSQERKRAAIDVDIVAIASICSRGAKLGGGKLIVAEVAGATDDQLRGVIDSLKKRSPSIAVLLGVDRRTERSASSPPSAMI